MRRRFRCVQIFLKQSNAIKRLCLVYETTVSLYTWENYQILCTCIVSTGSKAYGMYFVAPATTQNAVVCQTQQYMYLLLYQVLYISSIHSPMNTTTVCMYGHHIFYYSKSMDQPGIKVANPTRGQLKRENEYCPVRVRA